MHRPPSKILLCMQNTYKGGGKLSTGVFLCDADILREALFLSAAFKYRLKSISVQHNALNGPLEEADK